MRFEHFTLDGFAQHDHLDISFRHGEPNLIIGPNEAGKSNLMRALTGTLFGILRPEQFEPWHGRYKMSAQLTFMVPDQRIVIERLFTTHQVRVWIDHQLVFQGRGLPYGRGRGLTAEDEQYRSLLTEWIGFSEPHVFERTVFVGQELLADSGLGEFTARFKRLVSGTREADYETAIADLESRLDQLIKVPGKRANRKREDLVEQLEELNRRIAAAKRLQERVASLADEEKDLRTRIRESERTYQWYSELMEKYGELQRLRAEEIQARTDSNNLESQLERFSGYLEQRHDAERRRDYLRIEGDPEPQEIQELGRQIDQAKTRITDLRVVVERNQQIAQERESLQEMLDANSIPEDVDPENVRSMSGQFEQIEWEIYNLAFQRDELLRNGPEHSTKVFSPSVVRTLIGTLSVAVAATSLALGVLIDQAMFFGIAIGVIILFAGFSMTKGWAIRYQNAKDRFQEQLEQLVEHINQSRERLEDLRRTRDQLLEKTGTRSLDELEDRINTNFQTLARLESLPEIDEASSELDDRESPRGTKDSASAKLESAERELQALFAKRDNLLHRAKETDLDALYTRAVEYRETLSLLEQLPAPHDEELKSLNERRNAAQQRATSAAQRKEALLGDFSELSQMNAEDALTYRDMIEKAERQHRHLHDRLHKVQLERRKLGQETDDAEALRFDASCVREELESVELEAEAIQIALEDLRATVNAFHGEALDRVAEHASAHLNRITNGRYDRVFLDPETMEPSVNLNGQNRLQLHLLSHGTRDQLYLAIRASLIDALSGDRNLPMLLDDPCVNFDAARLENAAHLIQELARERQIFLFSKDESWTQWFEPVLRLDRRDIPVTG